jgi:hypothetical protein
MLARFIVHILQDRQSWQPWGDSSGITKWSMKTHSTDPLAVCAEGYGSKSGIPADSTQGHLVHTDLLGTNSESSRTGFFDESSSELAEMIMLAHDPGKS